MIIYRVLLEPLDQLEKLDHKEIRVREDPRVSLAQLEIQENRVSLAPLVLKVQMELWDHVARKEKKDLRVTQVG